MTVDALFPSCTSLRSFQPKHLSKVNTFPPPSPPPDAWGGAVLVSALEN